jgi:hypothetical protein
MIRIRDPKNFMAGLLFTGMAVVLACDALSLSLGTVSQMGPGYLPLTLAVILGGLGMVVIVNSLRLGGESLSSFEWRGFVIVTVAIVAFGATINRLGFIPAVVISVGICILASTRFRPVTAITLIAFLLAFCWVVFIWGLGLPVRLFVW